MYSVRCRTMITMSVLLICVIKCKACAECKRHESNGTDSLKLRSGLQRNSDGSRVFDRVYGGTPMDLDGIDVAEIG
jgi:hypothetical protein